MSVAKVSKIAATSGKSFEDALKQTERDGAQEESGRPITWSLRGRTYTPTTASRGLGRLDEDRANSMTDEGGPPRS